MDITNKAKQSLTPRTEVENQLSMSWQDLALPVFTSGTLMLVCFWVGQYGHSVIWILILTGLYLLKTRLWIKRQEARLNMRKQILRERGALGIGNSNEELPSWIRFPDTERIEWVNQLIQQLWPYIGEYATKFMREFIEPQVTAQMPSPFKSFRFLTIDMGDMPCRISGLKVYTQNVGRDRIIVDLEVAYSGDADFKVKVCGFTGGMNELILSGKVRCILEPLIPRPPMFAGITASFVELPKFDFNFTGMGDFLQMPVLIDAIRSVVNTQLANLCVLPNTIVLPLVPDLKVNKLYVPVPEGILRIKVVEAGNLENKDTTVLIKDSSDPYVEIQLGAQMFKTRTINNNLDPQFDEYFEAVVDQASAQTLRLNLFDYDTTGADEELGYLTIPAGYVQKTQFVSKWFNLEGCKHGLVYLKLFWCSLSADLSSIERPLPFSNEWSTANRPVHSSLMVVFVDNVKDLPNPKSNQEPSPVLEIIVSNAIQRTPVKVRTNNPVYMSKFIFLLQPTNKELQVLQIKALDSNTNRMLGELSIQIDYIMQQPNMEFFDKVFQLKHGVHISNITLTVRMRHIIPPDDKSKEFSTDLEHYANASYIERANDYEGGAKKHNGDAFASEPAKISELNAENHPESYLQLNRKQSATSSTISSRPSNDKSLLKKLIKHRKTEHYGVERQIALLEYGMRYNENNSTLILDINRVRNLVPLNADTFNKPYITAKLVQVNNNAVKSKKKTPTSDNTVNPVFNNRLEFVVESNELAFHKIQITVKDRNQYKLLSKTLFLTQGTINLANFNKNECLRDQQITLQPVVT